MNIDAIKKSSDEELLRIWNEMRMIQNIDFQYQEKLTAYELAPFLGMLLCFYIHNTYR